MWSFDRNKATTQDGWGPFARPSSTRGVAAAAPGLDGRDDEVAGPGAEDQPPISRFQVRLNQPWRLGER